ncbi:MAG: hypothetical protein EXS38_06250 [Opitutus sp.]|nr:hypothetical protein [Opitutus sp.]
MKLSCRSNSTLVRLLSALLLSCALHMPVAQAADEPAAPVDHPEERKVLELDLARSYSLIQQDTDPVTKVTLLGHQRELAARANRLLEKFDASKYDDLRYEINIQCQRLARKLAPLLTPPPSAKPEGTAEVAVYELDPSPTDKADVQAALAATDLALKRLEGRLSKMMIGSADYQKEQSRIQRSKDRRAALGKNFTEAGWTALANELRPPGR